VPPAVVAVVQRLTNQPGTPYEETIGRIAADYAATLVKIADNAHNSLVERACRLPAERRRRLAERYGTARAVLWSAVPFADVEAVVRRVNPALFKAVQGR
jgi:hypothetical protein